MFLNLFAGICDILPFHVKNGKAVAGEIRSETRFMFFVCEEKVRQKIATLFSYHLSGSFDHEQCDVIELGHVDGKLLDTRQDPVKDLLCRKPGVLPYNRVEPLFSE